MLRQEVAASGRIWLLLRHLDANGRGWVTLAEARAALTAKGASLRVCGWRQLRNLLAQGEGIFWRRTRARIWLRSTTKTAAALGVERLRGKPIALSIKSLLGTIGTVRAHLYASFHSGRDARKAGPIARATLAQLSHVHPRTQRNYERRAHVRTSANFALGQRARGCMQESVWQRGRALFEFADHHGRHGRPGQTYEAWQLPNSYVGPHPVLQRGRQKRINRELADLLHNGMTGNDQPSQTDTETVRRYYSRGQQAARAYNQRTERDIYWQQNGSGKSCRIWYCLPAQQAPRP